MAKLLNVSGGIKHLCNFTDQMSNMVAVVIPCYRVGSSIMQVLAAIGPSAGRIIVVDDACPEHSGDFVRENCTDPRVKVIINERNLGVGGAMKSGYRLSGEQAIPLFPF